MNVFCNRAEQNIVMHTNKRASHIIPFAFHSNHGLAEKSVKVDHDDGSGMVRYGIESSVFKADASFCGDDHHLW